MKTAINKTGLAALILVLGTYPLYSQRLKAKETIQEEIPVNTYSEDRTVIVANVFGSVTIEGHSGNSVVVNVDKTVLADNSEALDLGKAELKVKTFWDGNTLIIHPDAPYILYCDGHVRFCDSCDCDRQSWGKDNNCKWKEPDYQQRMDFTIQLPNNFRLEARTINEGTVLVKNTKGPYIKVGNINGPVTLENITGQTDVSAINGEVNISYAENPSKPSQYYSLNGDINIHFQSDLSADIGFKSMNGDLYSEFDIERQYNRTTKTNPEEGKGRYQFESRPHIQIGKGELAVKFETLNGDVNIKKI